MGVPTLKNRASQMAVRNEMISTSKQQPAATTLGKYRISPLTHRLTNGRFSANVSIRSGLGSSTTDRVMRFFGQFNSQQAAADYATEQGLIWVRECGSPMPA